MQKFDSNRTPNYLNEKILGDRTPNYLNKKTLGNRTRNYLNRKEPLGAKQVPEVQVFAGGESGRGFDEHGLDELGGEEPGAGEEIDLDHAIYDDTIRRIRNVKTSFAGAELAIAREASILLPEGEDSADAA
jgi:hypothetical protein